MTLRSFIHKIKVKSIKLGPVQLEFEKPKTIVTAETSTDQNCLSAKEDLIRAMDPNKLKFQELELTVSQIWDRFINLVQSSHPTLEITEILEDSGKESSFGCSGSPGSLKWSVRVLGLINGANVEYSYDLISYWLLPLAKSLGPQDGSIPWDNSLFEKPGDVGDYKTKIRNVTFWVLFVNT